MLNHSDSDVTSGYSHGYPMQRKRAVLDAWTRHVASVLGLTAATSDNVVHLKPRSA